MSFVGRKVWMVDDEVERLVEVPPDLIVEYTKAQELYSRSDAQTKELKAHRDEVKSRVVAAMGGVTGTATVSGTRTLGVRVTSQWRTDVTRLKAEAPDIARMFEKEVVSSRVDQL